MSNKDEYLVYTQFDGSRFYYKNKKLHREVGPAIVIYKDIAQYTNLSDETLYIPTDKPVEIIEIKGTDKSQGKTTQIVKIAHLKKKNLSLPKTYSFEDPIEYTYGNPTSTYWLEGINYSQQEFTSIMLKKEIEKELLKQEGQSKKLKL